MQGNPSREAMIGAKKNPRDSRQTMLDMSFEMSWVDLICSHRWETSASVAAGSLKMGKMSAKSCP
jgi:hypothetical protein